MSTATADPPADSAISRVRRATQGTVLQRYLAASLDNAVALMLAIATGIAVTQLLGAEDRPVQLSSAVVVYLAYFLAFEVLWSRTPGKLLTGLKVVGPSGEPCTGRQAVVRTVARLVEVNPILLGALPAAIAIMTNKHRQRLGDRLAETFVVFVG
ncbi:MAG: hypothetical protein CMJ58_06140 [Planctomycetaceae bacterium]|nr:hypothetical protein [Planctomycetaceae bacterium]